MIKVTGTSIIEVNAAALEKLLNGIMPDGVKGDLELKLDARANVKSTFMQTDGKQPAKGSLYTGAVRSMWDTSFTTSDNVKSEEEALVFIAAFAGLKYAKGKKYVMKVDKMTNTRVEDDFAQIKNGMGDLMSNYTKFSQETPVTSAAKPAKTSSSKAKSKVPADPLTNTPKVDIPEDIDLVGDITVPTVDEQVLHGAEDFENNVKAAENVESVEQKADQAVPAIPVEESTEVEGASENKADTAEAPVVTEDVNSQKEEEAVIPASEDIMNAPKEPVISEDAQDNSEVKSSPEESEKSSKKSEKKSKAKGTKAEKKADQAVPAIPVEESTEVEGLDLDKPLL